MAPFDLIDRFRLEAHTGENRCVSCTVVNAGLAAVLSVGVTLSLLRADRGIAFVFGCGTFLTMLVLIYVRGYVVPGTPWFTKTYLPESVLRWFDGTHVEPTYGIDGEFSGTDVASSGGDVESSGVDVEPLLRRAGVLEDCRNEDDLCLTPEFRSAWYARMEGLEAGGDVTSTAARFLDVDPTGLSVTESAGSVILHEDRRPKGKWESRPALVADLAADRELERRVDEWASLDVHRQSSVLQGLRVFLDRCPACDGRVSADETEVDSCCRASTVVAVSCDACHLRIAEIDQVGR